MQRKVFLLALVLSLLVVFSSTAGVMADKGGTPHDAHDAGCAAYCARAIVHQWDADIEDWVPLDDDGDGKVEKCLREFPDGTTMCIKWERGNCPEVDGDGDGVEDRCVMPEDDWGFWCRLMHGEDTHGRGHIH